MTTEEIAKSSKPIRVPLHPGIQHKEVDLPVDPYVLGVWLGDGAASSGTITTSDPGIWDEILERGYKLGPVFHDKRGENCESRTVYGLVGQLKELGVWENKHIPATYLRASEEQRRDLLAGLLDTDGYYNPARREVTVDTTKDWWVDGLKELVGSLGGKTTVCDYITNGFGKKWAAKQIRILTRFNPFKVKDIDFELTRHAKTVREFNYVAACEEVPSVPTQCVKVTSPAHTYLFGRGFHTTHNTSDLDKKVTFTKQAKSLWPDLPAKLSSIYALQLSFYAYILEQQGYKVHGLHLMAETAGTWAKHTVPKLDIREALEAVWK